MNAGVTPVPIEEIPRERLAEYHHHIQRRLGIDTVRDPDPLLSLPQIAELAGLSPNTPSVWRQRTRRGEARVPFPEPGTPTGKRNADKPMWAAVTEVIPYLEATHNWPPDSGARPGTRAPRRHAA
jgi:hypothetical protein